MTTLKWPRRSTFVDRERDVRVEAGKTVDVDDSDVVDHYLDRGFVEADDDDGPDDDFDLGAFLDQPASAQAGAIKAGDVDNHLETIDAANDGGQDYKTVRQAIDARREEL